MKRFSLFLLPFLLLPLFGVTADETPPTNPSPAVEVAQATSATVKRSQSAPQSVNGMTVLITGPEAVEIGDLVIIDGSASDADAFVWKLVGGSSSSYAVSDDGKKVYFAGKTAGQYTFMLALAKASPDGKTPPALTIAEHTVAVSGPPPAPGPVPTPGPTPLPPGKFGLAEFTRSLVLSNMTADKRGPCVQFAGNFTSVSQQINGGVIKSLADAMAKLKTLNQSAAGTAMGTWQASVFKALADKLTALNQAGTLSTTDMAALATALQEIATGFAASSN